MRTNEEWKAIFEDQESSGMAIKEYCKAHKIGVASFYKHKRLIIQNEETFNPVSIVDDEPITSIVEFKINEHTISCDIKYLHLIVSAL